MKNELKITPVRHYFIPKYPTKMDVRISPAILRAVPRRWDVKPAVCMALMFTLSTGLYGCADGNNAGGGVSTGGNTALSLSIPIFEHGVGRGSYGCSSVAPPVFLSEEEALQVIREEAEARGVNFDDTKSIEGDHFPATNEYDIDGTDNNTTWEGTLELDGYDSTLGIGFEFVSQEDVVAWENKDTEMLCSVSSFYMKSTAERLADVVKNTAVFYDPASNYEDFKYDWNGDSADYETYMNQYTAEQKERMLEDLREQVRDFLDWLAAEGII